MSSYFIILSIIVIILTTLIKGNYNIYYDNVKGLSAGETTTGCSYSQTCTAGGIEGVCVSISAGCCSGTTTSNLCSGSSDIKCCTSNKCSTPAGSGVCEQTSKCGGTSYSGYCTGPSDLQCCVSGTPPAPTSSTLGLDISAALSSSTASCFTSSGYSFIIPRGYRSSGSVDPNVCTSLKAAYSAGFKTRDVYMFPCPTCSTSAKSQLSALVSYLNSNCKSQWSGRVWLDIEGSQYWTGSTSNNQAWYKSLKDSCGTLGVRCGVYSSASQWSAIFGSSFCYGQELPLWYAHYDNTPNFNDFSSFACWKSPHAKQYAGDISTCSMDTDRNYSPNF